MFILCYEIQCLEIKLYTIAVESYRKSYEPSHPLHLMSAATVALATATLHRLPSSCAPHHSQCSPKNSFHHGQMIFFWERLEI